MATLTVINSTYSSEELRALFSSCTSKELDNLLNNHQRIDELEPLIIECNDAAIIKNII